MKQEAITAGRSTLLKVLMDRDNSIEADMDSSVPMQRP